MDLAKATLETLELLRMVVPIMFFGLLFSNLVFSHPKVRKFVEPIDRITEFAKVRCGTVVLAFFAHPIAGLSVLSDLYRKGALEEREVTVIYIISLIPRNVRIVLMFLAPIALSALGPVLGAIYSSLELMTRLAVIFVGILIARRFVDTCTVEYDHLSDFSLKDNVFRSLRLFLRTIAVFVPSVFLVMLLLDAGFLEVLNGMCRPIMDGLGIPTSGLMIIAAGTTSMVAGIGVAGSLLAKGAIDGFSALISIIVASIFHGFVECIRRTLAINVSFFGKLGVRLALINLVVRELACLMALAILLAFRTLNILS